MIMMVQPTVSSIDFIWPTDGMEYRLYMANRLFTMFGWLISQQPPVNNIFLSEQTGNQSAILFFENKSAPATSQTNRSTQAFLACLDTHYGKLGLCSASRAHDKGFVVRFLSRRTAKGTRHLFAR
jgi:hypothetical protein